MAFVHNFAEFREQLDDHNERRERLIRDVTILAKRIIFLLHRVVIDGTDVDSSKSAVQQGREKLAEIQVLFSKMRPELEGDNFWRYHRQVSPGLQEYIEALSFAHYLEHGTLITFSQVQASLCDSNGVIHFPLTISDYLLGLSDLTGELMRFAITGLSRRGGRSKALEVCAFVRGCKGDFEQLVPHIWELSKKQSVTNQSLQKIEDACYAIVVRGSEYDLSPDLLDDIVAQSISSSGLEQRYKYERRDAKDNDAMYVD
ncbi:Translin [Mycena floridula]|nr:Translin [Mycena floridula]